MRVEHLVGLVVSDIALKTMMICIELQVSRYVYKYCLCQAPTHFLWLLLCFLSHSYLNFCAELLRFGDRHFYGDWWSVALKNVWHRFLARVNIVLLTQFLFFFKGMPQPWFLSGRTGASLARSGVTGVVISQWSNWSEILVPLHWKQTQCYGFALCSMSVLLTQRHVYSRLVENNVTPSHAELLIFLMSAALCEVQWKIYIFCYWT